MNNVVFLNIGKINYDNKLDLSIFTGATIYNDTKEDEILDRTKNAEIVVTKELPMKKEIIDNLSSSVKLIIEAGTGYNNIDLEACKNKNIRVCNVPSYSTNHVAELVFFHMLLQANMNNTELNGKTLGVIGTGEIGTKVIEIAKSYNMNVVATSRTKKEGINYIELDELLKISDYVSLNIPLTKETKHLIDLDKLKLMKQSAVLINTARGSLIKEEDLIYAIENNIINGAGLDVLEVEPLSIDNKLSTLKKVFITNHTGWKSIESRTRLLQIVLNNINSYYDNNLINEIN